VIDDNYAVAGVVVPAEEAEGEGEGEAPAAAAEPAKAAKAGE